jgi:hypothetical protein
VSGWFAMKRGLHDHPIFKGQPLRVAAWSWMVATAAWKDTRQNAGGAVVTIRRGQLLTSYRQMSEATGVPVQVLRTLICQLRGEHAISTDTNTGRMLITICNYDKYQGGGDTDNKADNTASTQRQHTKEQENKRTTEEEAKASLSSGDDDESSPPVRKPRKPASPQHLNDIAEAVDAYNETAAAAGWPKVQVMSKPRRAALNARLLECGGLDGWRLALAKARASPHLCGDNDRGWRADFDFLTSQKKFAKLLEGSYDPIPCNRTAGPADGPRNRPDPATEQILRLAGLGAASGYGRP